MKILIVLLIVALPFIVKSAPLIWICNLAAVYAILTLSWLFMHRYSGYVSFAHSVPFGLAAYAFVFVGMYAALVSAIVSTAIFAILSKLGREKFVFATFVVAVCFWITAPYITLQSDSMMYGGEEGFPVTSLSLFESYVVSSLVLLIFLVLLTAFDRTRLGLAMLAIGDDEVSAMGVGIDVEKLKILSFFASSFAASTAGICYALFFGHVSPEVYSIEIAIFPFIATLFGQGFVAAILSSYMLVAVTRATTVVQYHLIVYAILLMLSPKLRRWRNARVA